MEDPQKPDQRVDGTDTKTTATHSTTFSGPVTAGAISTGSGAIYLDNLTQGVSTASNKEEFLAALRAFKKELEQARNHGLPEDTADDVVIELEAAEKEVVKEKPHPERVAKRLEKAKDILSAAVGLATAATGAAAAAQTLLPWFQTALNTVMRLFHG